MNWKNMTTEELKVWADRLENWYEKAVTEETKKEMFEEHQAVLAELKSRGE